MGRGLLLLRWRSSVLAMPLGILDILVRGDGGIGDGGAGWAVRSGAFAGMREEWCIMDNWGFVDGLEGGREGISMLEIVVFLGKDSSRGLLPVRDSKEQSRYHRYPVTPSPLSP